jgi:hypothetical protein
MSIVGQGLQARQQRLDARMRELAYERWLLTRHLEDIDKELSQLEGAAMANSLTAKDIETEVAIEAAQTTEAPDSAG